MFRYLLAPAIILYSFASSASPQVAPEAEKLCLGYEETVEIMWRDASGADVLRARFASDENGTGCYAWLNTVAQWNIGRTGSMALKDVKRDGSRRTTGDKTRGLFVDLEAGTVDRYFRGRRTKGIIISP